MHYSSKNLPTHNSVTITGISAPSCHLTFFSASTPMTYDAFSNKCHSMNSTIKDFSCLSERFLCNNITV